jgi:hypothetical protein
VQRLERCHDRRHGGVARLVVDNIFGQLHDVNAAVWQGSLRRGDGGSWRCTRRC